MSGWPASPFFSSDGEMKLAKGTVISPSAAVTKKEDEYGI
jgi:hypothetical protein